MHLSIIMRIVNRELPHLVRVEDDKAWDEFTSRENAHLLQSIPWGELKSRFGWHAEHWAQVEDGRVQAGAQVLLRRLLPGLTVAYVPRGPISCGGGFLEALRECMQRRGVFLLKLEPNWLSLDAQDRLLVEAGFHPSTETVQPPTTIRIDLTPPLENIFAAMKSKWRYNIRLAERKGVGVREGTAADLPVFYQLLHITAERDRFAVHPLPYYRLAFELLSARNSAHLLVAEFERQVIAAIFVSVFGQEAIYLYGASGNEHRNTMPNHALHWAAIQMAKNRGCKWYDLWGIPDIGAGRSLSTPSRARQEAPNALPGSLFEFKSGFGGEAVRYSGAWDYVISPNLHKAYRLARTLRRSGLGA